MRNPSANPLQAGVLLGIVLTIVLIVLVSVILLIMRPSAEDEELLREERGEGPEAEAPAQPMSWPTVASIAVLAFFALWAVTGVTTSSSDVCLSCHSNTSHASAGTGDPHAKVACVSCHEGGGFVGRATVNLVTRVQHVIAARVDSSRAIGYGKPAASDGCTGCHRQQTSRTTLNRKRGVRVSHKEPLAAGAQCVDCHVLEAGVVGAATVGMAPCLRCHDGKTAKAECSVCHAGDPSGAIRSAVTTGAMASALVPNPQCDGCHADMSKCDACHGISMPHSLGFTAYGHARDAAIDIWNNGSNGAKTCSKCHYPGHNDCQQSGCHNGRFPSHPSPAWRDLHKLATWSGSQSACSCHRWDPWDHNGMNYCQICHPVKPANAHP
jgi:hypothetical protein